MLLVVLGMTAKPCCLSFKQHTAVTMRPQIHLSLLSKTKHTLFTCAVGKTGDGVLRWSGFRITIRPVESSDIRQTSFILCMSDMLMDVR